MVSTEWLCRSCILARAVYSSWESDGAEAVLFMRHSPRQILPLKASPGLWKQFLWRRFGGEGDNKVVYEAVPFSGGSTSLK